MSCTHSINCRIQVVADRPPSEPSRAVLIFPMRRHALLRDAVHLLRANLHLERLPGMNHRGMQRLIQIGPRHGDVILESPRHRPPDLMNHAQRGITIPHVVGYHPHRQQVVNLIQRALLLFDFDMQRIKALDAALALPRECHWHQLLADRALHFGQELFVHFLLRRDLLLQLDDTQPAPDSGTPRSSSSPRIKPMPSRLATGA